jgi:hypothetical protein
MKRLIVGWATVLAVAVIVGIPALAQGVPDTPDTPPGKAPGDEQVKSDVPIASPDVSPSPAAPPETTLLEPPPLEVPSSDVPLADVPPPPDAPPPSIGEQKAGDEGVANEAVEEHETGNGPVREAGDPEIGSRQAKREVEEQEVEDREVELDGIGKAGIGKASDEKAGDPKQETEQDADSGDADQSVDVINTGDNVNVCLGVLQAANTGNAQNAQGVVQDGSEADEVELEDGSSITITPQLIVDCRQIIYQIVTGQQLGAGDRDATLRGGALRGGSNVPGFGQLALGTNRAALKVAGTSSTGLSKAAATRRSLPRTGGGALLGLGAGVVLIAGGPAVRRIFR